MTAAPKAPRRNEPEGIERPLPSESGDQGVWGSDAVADLLRALDIPYVALNPGASYRGLHDSLVNRLGNERPQMLLSLHEESAVAIAHGWAKVAGKPMAAIVHSNVGLMHATMAVFNAWCDRAPLLLLGATGPVDAAKRRPWIDWIHTARDQGALVRPYTKWDDQPASVEAAQESILRAWKIIQTAPRGPAYVCLDAGLQEAKLETAPPLPDISRFRAPPDAAPDAALAATAAKRLHEAQRPVILMGRVSRGEPGWAERVKLAESLGAVVLTDLKQAGSFPSDHPLLGASPTTLPGVEAATILRAADCVLALDWIDLAGTLKAAWRGEDVKSFVIHATLDGHLHNGWSMDHQGLAPVDLALEFVTRARGVGDPRGVARFGAAPDSGLAGTQAGGAAPSCPRSKARGPSRCRIWRRRCARRCRGVHPRCCAIRCPGPGISGRSITRSISSAATAAAASAPAPAPASARRWRSGAACGCRWRCWATAIS